MPSPKSILTVIALVTALAMCPACGESDQASQNVTNLRFGDHSVSTQHSYGKSAGLVCGGYYDDEKYNYSIRTKPEDFKKLILTYSKGVLHYIDDETKLYGMFFQRTGSVGIAGLADSLCEEAYALAKKHPQTKRLRLEVWFREKGPVAKEDIFKYRLKGTNLGYLTFCNLDQARQCVSADEYSAKMIKLVSANIRATFKNLRVFKDY